MTSEAVNSRDEGLCNNEAGEIRAEIIWGEFMKEIHKDNKDNLQEGWIVYWNSNGWGHVASVDSKHVRFFLHKNDFDCERSPLLGERIKFLPTAPFGDSLSPNRLPRASQARPWMPPDEPADEEAGEAAGESLFAAGEAAPINEGD